ncbi:MAG TPA: PDDEXK nuclease domain-containing protein, partial [Alicycliphilus sp.]|nr:PDDEXK nuclease domain-containing protein [Alicycliphilus sp.]
MPALYATLLADIKQRVRRAQVRAMLAVNAELIRLYWDIGRVIDERQQQEGWGAGVIPRLARDLHNDLPEEKGFSERNIKQMLAFYREYAQLSFVQQPAAQIETEPKVPQAAALFTAELILALPWTHHAILMAKVKDPATRHWYMQAALEHGWSRSILVMQIETAAHQRQGRAASNFALRLPKPESDLVQQTLKAPYVVIELKRGEFKPEYAGKMNFYCSVVDDRLRHA